MGTCNLVSALIHRERYRRTVFDGVKRVKLVMVFCSKVFVASLIDTVSGYKGQNTLR